MGEREDSVRKCCGMFPSSHELRRGGLVETPTWLCEAARSTASSYSTFSRPVTTSMSFPCLATIGVLILAFSLCSSSHPLKFPYACELKIVTGLPWVSFQSFAWSFHAPPFLPLSTSLCVPGYSHDHYVSYTPEVHFTVVATASPLALT